MNAVQVMRQQAYQAGNLKSNQQQASRRVRRCLRPHPRESSAYSI
jgi:hypothetical protein